VTDEERKPEANQSEGTLERKIMSWLAEQGYPTEFRAANICRSHGFRVFHGSHVQDEKSQVVREIDVVAATTLRSDGHIIRVEHIIECKLSTDKPWIVFTSPFGQMQPSACVAQTIASPLGEAAIWALAGDTSLHKLDFFCVPKRP
jgi:hypothetical protein